MYKVMIRARDLPQRLYAWLVPIRINFIEGDNWVQIIVNDIPIVAGADRGPSNERVIYLGWDNERHMPIVEVVQPGL